MDNLDLAANRRGRALRRRFRRFKQWLSRFIPLPLGVGNDSETRAVEARGAPKPTPRHHCVHVNDLVLIFREIAQHEREDKVSLENMRILAELVAISSPKDISESFDGIDGVVARRLQARRKSLARLSSSSDVGIDTVDGAPSASGYDVGMHNLSVEGRSTMLDYRTVGQTTRMHLPGATGGTDQGVVFRVYAFLDVPTDAEKAKTDNTTNLRQMALEIVAVVNSRPIPTGQFLDSKTAFFKQEDTHKPPLDVFVANPDYLFNVKHFHPQEMSTYAWPVQLVNDDGEILAPDSPSAQFGGNWMDLVQPSVSPNVRVIVQEVCWPSERVSLHH